MIEQVTAKPSKRPQRHVKIGGDDGIVKEVNKQTATEGRKNLRRNVE